MIAVVMVVCAILVFGGAALINRTQLRHRRQPSPQMAGAPIAIGTVVGLENTHRGYNGAMYYDVALDVRCPDGQRFTGVTRQLMYGGRKATMQPGAVWPVRYRPTEPGVIELVEDTDPRTQTEVSAAFAALGMGPGQPPA